MVPVPIKISKLNKAFYRIVKETQSEHCYIDCVDTGNINSPMTNLIKITFSTIQYTVDIKNAELIITSTLTGQCAFIAPNSAEECKDWDDGLQYLKDALLRISKDSHGIFDDLTKLGY